MATPRPSSDPLAPAAAALALWRGVFMDLPLVWAMELTRFAEHAARAQAEHWLALAGCTDLREVAEAQRRFAGEALRELRDEAEALSREAEIAVGTA